MPAIEVIDLEKSFSRGVLAPRKQALKKVCFCVEQGKITGFLGANGAGKTTTLKCLLNLIRPDRGQTFFLGQPSSKLIQSGEVGFLPEKPYFYDYLTGFELLEFYASLSAPYKKHLKKRKDLLSSVHQALKDVELYTAKDQPLKSYSKGMLQRVGFAQSIIHRPQLVILDEPLSGLDPEGRTMMKKMIRRACSEGSTVFLSSHLLSDIEELCSHLVILSQGKKVFSGPVNEFINPDQFGYELHWREKGKDQQQEFSSLNEANHKIDELRREKNEVIQLKKQGLSLEESFSLLDSKEDDRV